MQKPKSKQEAFEVTETIKQFNDNKLTVGELTQILENIHKRYHSLDR